MLDDVYAKRRSDHRVQLTWAFTDWLTDQDCHDVALKHGIQLSEPEADYDSGSTECKTILRGYGICPETANAEATITSSTSTFATATASIAPSNVTSSNSTVNGTLPTNSTTNSTTTNSTMANLGVVTLTDMNTATLTYTEGTGSKTRQRVVVVTHTNIDLITESTSTTAKAHAVATKVKSGRASSSPATATSGETPSTFATKDDAASSAKEAKTSQSIFVVDVSSLPSTTSASSIVAHTKAVKASAAASACNAANVPAPAATQHGIVSGCTKWYVAAPGDYCSTIADRYNIPVDTFMAWNPAVIAPICSNMNAGNAYCVSTSCEGALAVTSSTSQDMPSAVTSSMSEVPSIPSLSVDFSTSTTARAAHTGANSTLPLQSGAATSTSSATPSASSSTVEYKSYLGDGSEAAGWPSEKRWVSFDSMFTANQPHMKESCAQWGVPNDTDDEISEMKSAIKQVASTSGVDARFILAIVMQESTGCVRVITTQYSVFNPGLMQSHNGAGSCNENNVSTTTATSGPYHSNGTVLTPCPASQITQMIRDGTQGTSSGDGLQQLLSQQKGFAGAEMYYRAARAYNGGSVAASGKLEDGCCTRSYASDVANRLVGWSGEVRSFSG
ncbi:hypothetical protein PRZ48_000536 [Zasmidium cellare]|uniref:LysM domain-containing protein n=1 Tax=Zasmidium cellare TaxID=395010 RepID=A0ABR0F0C7_ZASCE|nr:hypothetical protein PRZ48_000536 [Zasmidium cellare]